MSDNKKQQPEGLKPGIYFNLSNEDYHNDPAISCSGIKHLLESPLQYWWNSPLNSKKTLKTTETLTIGKAIHSILLDSEEEFFSNFIILPSYPKIDKTKVRLDDPIIEELQKSSSYHEDFEFPKTARGSYITYKGNKDVLGDRLYNDINTAIKSLKELDLLSALFQGGYSEVSIFWKDQETGLICKCRHDYLKHSLSADYKSIEKVTDSSIRVSISKYKYDLQAAFYLEGLNQIKSLLQNNQAVIEGNQEQKEWLKDFTKNIHSNFVFLFQSKEEPYIARANSLNADILEIGEAKFRRGLEIYQDSLEKYGIEKWESGFDGVYELGLDDLPAGIQYL